MFRILRSAAALFTCVIAGCAGTQTPIATPAQSHAMGPFANKGDLLYVDEGYRQKQSESGRVAIYTYPGLKLVGKFTVSKPGAPPSGTTGMCSDAQGNVFVGGDYDQNAAIYEYAHGGTSPIAVLNDGAYDANDCAVDAVTGNLAVVNYVTNTSPNVSIFQNAQGSPTIYTDPSLTNYISCTYDDDGNLFVDGTASNATVIVELPAGSSTFTNIALNVTLRSTGAILWRKGLLVIQDQGARKIYSVSLSGSSGSVVSTTPIRKQKGAYGELDYIYDGRLIGPDGNHLAGGQLGIWPYPAGGPPTKVFSTGNVVNPYSATISVSQ